MILLLETATDICSIGISQEGRMLSLVEIEERIDHAARINELILRACQEANCSLEDLDAVAISKGPGSYTSLRVGTATAKGICFALDKPLIALDTLTSLAHTMKQLEAGPFVYAPMIDARRMEVYTAFYDQDLHLIKEVHPLIIEADVFSSFLENNTSIVIAGNGAEKCLAVLPEQIRFISVKCSASHLAKLAHVAYQNHQFESLAYFEPLYLKPPNITKAKKRL